MLKYIAGVIGVILWLYLLSVLKRAKLRAWHFIVGALGLFTLLMIFLMPYASDPLAKCVAVVAGLFGQITGWFEPYFKYSLIFITSGNESISMLIDMECSGIIEILAFECLLIFFDLYTREEKIIVGIIGFLYIILLNALRIVLICTIVHFFGTGAFYVAHTFIGRIFFYIFAVILYFYVFTKAQVVKMKVGKVTYGRFKRDS